MRKRIWDTITLSLPLSIAASFVLQSLLWVFFLLVRLEEGTPRSFVGHSVFAVLMGIWIYFHYKQERRLKKARVKS